MAYIRGVDRNEVLLFPECVEDYITEDNPVRFIDAFVESLDLVDLGFVRSTAAETGRLPYDPAALEDFNYDEVKDYYRCPQGEELNFRFENVELNRQIRYYATAKCRGCPIKESCTTNKAGRRITRWVDEQLLEEMARRVRARPDMMKQRQRIVEHPFGTIKRAMNQGYFLTRGLKKVGAEMSLTVLSYNIKRAINIIGVKKMIEAVT